MFSSKKKTEGLLTVTIVNATNLDAKDKDGFSDPYVELQIDGQKYKTRYIPNTLNPVWKEDFLFTVKDHNVAVLDIVVKDKNKLLKDVQIGKVSYPLKGLNDNDTVELALPLIACTGGTVYIVLKTSEDFCIIPKTKPRSIQPMKPRSMSITHAHDPIKHVILLCLENRSFDQILGALTDLDLDGASDKNYNLDLNGVKHYQKPIQYKFNREDVVHSNAYVMKQIANNNSGFITATQEYDKEFEIPQYPERLDEIMGYFPSGSLPAIHTLARNFTVCDRWFSSVPGETWPNRYFLMTGTSRGRVNMPDEKGITYKPYIQKQPSLFDRLEENNISQTIYYEDFALSLLLPRQWEPTALAHYRLMSQFYKDCKGPEKEFPSFAFIEPRYGGNANDSHAPHVLMNTQHLIADIYNAIRGNEELWYSSLFIITYDEHGGFYDHVPTPATVPPDEFTTEYTFDRLGVRVPTILISPWIDKRVDHTIYDHTSILKHLQNKWGLGPLGQRTVNANDFAKDILQKPRRDCIQKIEIEESKDTELRSGVSSLPFNGLQKDARKLLKRMIPHLNKQELNPMMAKVSNWIDFTRLVAPMIEKHAFSVNESET
jgi:phospholipase C